MKTTQALEHVETLSTDKKRKFIKRVEIMIAKDNYGYDPHATETRRRKELLESAFEGRENYAPYQHCIPVEDWACMLSCIDLETETKESLQKKLDVAIDLAQDIGRTNADEVADQFMCVLDDPDAYLED